MPTKYSLKYGLVGLALAGVAALLVWYLPDKPANIILALLLATASGIYLKYAINRRDAGLVVVELIMMLLFIVLGIAGVLISPFYLALGYLLHGFWDMAHHPRYIRTSGPAWYQPACLTFDWTIVLYIVVRN